MSTPFGLIIEDDPDLSDIFSEALKAAGYETETILDGKIAMRRLDEITANVIILDLHLPNVSGATIFERIQSDEKFKNTRVVICTADAIMAETFRDESDFVLVKPISFGQLRDLSARLISLT